MPIELKMLAWSVALGLAHVLLGAALGGLTGIPDGQVRTYESIANPNIDRDFLAASISYAF